MRTLVMPAFEPYRLREMTIGKIDRFLKAQAKISYSRAKHSKVVLNLALGLALRYEAIPRNPVPGTARLMSVRSGSRARQRVAESRIAAMFIRASARFACRSLSVTAPIVPQPIPLLKRQCLSYDL